MYDFDTPFQKIDPAICGHKFAMLHRLNRISGIHVPPAFCLPEKSFPTERIRRALHEWKQLAIRSSASFEDLPGCAAAGILNSFLNVREYTAAKESIRKCLSSGRSYRARYYLKKRGISFKTMGIAAICQQYIPAHIGGTAFTANPVNGLSEMIVEKRNVDPQNVDRMLVNSEMVFPDRVDAEAPDWLNALRGAISKILPVCGELLDIEWVWHDQQIFIVQCRPLMTDADRPRQLEHLWTRGQIGEILPLPLTPLSQDIFARITLHASRRRHYSFADRAGNQLEKLRSSNFGKNRRFRVFDGYVYQNLRWLFSHYLSRPWTTPQHLSSGLGFRLPANLDHRSLSGFGRLRRAANSLIYLLEFMLPRFSLERRVRGVVNAEVRRLQSRQKMPSLKREVIIARFLLGWQQALTGRILSHLGIIDRLSNWLNDEFSQSPPVNRALAQLRNDRSFKELRLLKQQWQSFSTGSGNASIGKGPQELQEIFYDNYRLFLEEFGHRSFNELELMQPAWNEDDRTLIDLLDTRVVAAQDAMKVKQQVPWVIGKILKRLEMAVEIRSRIKSDFVRHYRNIRKIYLQHAEELIGRGKICDREDLFFLTCSEVENIINLGPRELRSRIDERRHSVQKAYCHPPQFYRYRGVEEEADRQRNSEVLMGIGCSSGVRTGRALLVTGFSQDIAVSPDEIIVANSADPGWTPLLLNAGGMVTEIGGMLSHIATVARESQIPFVVNVTGGMQRIRNGQIITVDGDNGRVIIEE